ncbi:MAG: TIGR02530 family flagellar biosynthesis protein [Halanaerobium sp.]|nr:TIGR02530 family flagellar biosynthesis protein [Halanaerobium sp.]
MNDKLNINSGYNLVDRPSRVDNRRGEGISPKGKECAQRLNFKELLQKEIGGEDLKFSRHALKRLESREVQLNGHDLQRLKEAVDKVEEKGARESLLLMDDVAYIVSVKNRTVITAVDGESMKDNVFTNIDSAVILQEGQTQVQRPGQREYARYNRPDLIRGPETAE